MVTLHTAYQPLMGQLGTVAPVDCYILYYNPLTSQRYFSRAPRFR